MARVQNHPQWNNIRLGHKIQEQLARDLHIKAGVPLTSCTLDHVKQFQMVTFRFTSFPRNILMLLYIKDLKGEFPYIFIIIMSILM